MVVMRMMNMMVFRVVFLSFWVGELEGFLE